MRDCLRRDLSGLCKGRLRPNLVELDCLFAERSCQMTSSHGRSCRRTAGAGRYRNDRGPGKSSPDRAQGGTLRSQMVITCSVVRGWARVAISLPSEGRLDVLRARSCRRAKRGLGMPGAWTTIGGPVPVRTSVGVWAEAECAHGGAACTLRGLGGSLGALSSYRRQRLWLERCRTIVVHGPTFGRGRMWFRSDRLYGGFGLSPKTRAV